MIQHVYSDKLYLDKLHLDKLYSDKLYLDNLDKLSLYIERSKIKQVFITYFEVISTEINTTNKW